MVTSSANDKIIAAAREAGFDWEDLGLLDRLAFGRLYALAYRQGMEDAAKCAEAQQDLAEQEKADKRFKAAMKDLEAGKATEQNAVDRGDHWMCVATCNAVLRNAAKAIRSLKEQP
jgi:hypothetical protein